MPAIRIAVSVSLIGITTLAVLNGQTAQSTPTTATTGFPAAVHTALRDIDRFRDPGYFTLLASDGIRAVDPRVLASRAAAAAAAGEPYKALYLARVFTWREPSSAAGWTNRAQLAAVLGFSEEATAAEANAVTGSAVSVRGGALPGAIAIKPSTLADWAAALALVADDVSAREGRPAVVAVRDDLSGLDLASNEEITQQNRGPWVTAKAVQAEHIPTNLFMLADATPMDRKSMKGGMFALGAVALAGSGYASSIGVADAAASLANLYGSAMAKAFEVPSNFKGGSFAAVTFTGQAPKRAAMAPKTSGKHEAVGTPLAMLWASGESLSPTVPAVWRNGDGKKSDAMRIDSRAKSQPWKAQAIPPLAYPRLQQLCLSATNCSTHASALEVMLSREDVHAFAPGVEVHLPDFSAFAVRYAQGEPLSIGSAGQQFTGFDAAGVTYVTKHQPTQWLAGTPASPAVKPTSTQ